MSADSLQLQFKRGALSAFRRFLNEKYKDEVIFRNFRWGQRTRRYGDYLFAQDRVIFDVTLRHFHLEPEFDRTPWLK